MKKRYIYLLVAVFAMLQFVNCSQKEDPVQPVAKFTLSTTEIYVDQSIQFQNKSTDAEYYSWDFGDGNSSTDENPFHTYTQAGKYTISLRAINKGLEDTFTESIDVFNEPSGSLSVATKSVVNISASEVESGGNINNDSGEAITAKGVCWGREENPTLSSNMGSTNDGTGDNSYTSRLTGLMPNTTYFVRAYVTTNSGTYYDNGSIEFTTIDDGNDPIPPTVKTESISDITDISVVCYANVTSDGGAAVTERGVCYSFGNNPTLSSNDGVWRVGSGTGAFTAYVSGLETDRTYYICAYATNSAGTNYGDVLEFKTLPRVDKVVEVQKTDVAPIIDGQIDNLWNNVPFQLIDRTVRDDQVSFNKIPTFKAIWDDTFLYLLIEVDDDNFYPYYDAGVDSWLADKPQLYFDVNNVLVDGFGPEQPNSGHIVVAQDFDQPVAEGIEFGFNVIDDSRYVVEYAIRFSEMFDKDGQRFHPNSRNTIGFDIDVIDLDEKDLGGNQIEGRAIWANNAETDENWTNMDDAGKMVFFGTSDNVVNFSADKTLVNVNDQVSFTDLSSPTPSTFLWRFGDGAESTEQNPFHTYTQAGTYTVSLDVQFADGSTLSDTKFDYITVENAGVAPTADFVSNTNSIVAGESVQFTDMSTGEPTSWGWDFDGDGSVESHEQNPVYTYTVPGIYTVSLSVGNVYGDDVEVKTGFITVGSSGVSVTGVSVSPDNITISVNQTQQLTAAITPWDASDQSVTWMSSNSTIASVDTNGLVTANADGIAIITVRTNDGGFEATSHITVTQTPAFTTTVQAEHFSDYSGAVQVTSCDTDSLVGFFNPTDWVLYQGIDIPSTGTYTIDLRLTNGGANSTVFHIEQNNTDVSGSITVDPTGDWCGFTNATQTLQLNIGSGDIKIVVDEGQPNFDWFTISNQ